MSPVLPTASKLASNVLAKTALATDSTYKYLYFGLHGRGELTRTLLVASGAKFEELAIDWPVHKELTPFNCVPVVYETGADGTVLELSETQAIERYLSKKYGYLGDNAWEEHLVNRYFNSTDHAQNTFASAVTGAQPGEGRVEAANNYYKDTLAKWIVLHEKHLEANNGGNGHYVGNDLTLADFKTALLVDRLLLLHPKGANAVPLSAEQTPNIWKVREAVNNQKHIATWKKTERYAELDQGTLKLFKFI
ncbi:hypothetical protein BG004_005617 [Podila humilis]|nr:hypothetical protein BG004_005617 [Podila humilis]